MYEELKKILEDQYGITEFGSESNFKKDLELDSFDLMNLICIIEDKYNIELDEEKYRELTTIQEMCDYIGTLVA